MFERLFKKKKERNELKEENKFLYELLTDDNLENFDSRLKISRMHLIYELQNILQQKQKETEKKYYDEELDCLINLEEESQNTIDKYAEHKNDLIKSELKDIQNKKKILLSENERLKQKISNLQKEIKKKKKQIF